MESYKVYRKFGLTQTITNRKRYSKVFKTLRPKERSLLRRPVIRNLCKEWLSSESCSAAINEQSLEYKTFDAPQVDPKIDQLYLTPKACLEDVRR